MIQFLSIIAVSLISINSFASDFSTQKEKILKKSQKISKKYKIPSEQIGFSIINLDNPKESIGFNSSKKFTPASLAKFFTTIYTLEKLPMDFQFTTRIFHTGSLIRGVLKGDLFLVGGGDPFLTHNEMMGLVESLVKYGIKKVEGKFFYDDSSFPGLSKISEIGFGDQTYNPSLSALNLEFNRFKMVNKQAVPGIDYLKVRRNRKSLPPGMKFTRLEEDGFESWNYDPIQRYKYAQEIPIRDSSQFTAQIFKDFARKRGIRLSPPLRQVLPKRGTRIIFEKKSHTLNNLIHLMMSYSNNLFAEALLLQSSQEKSLMSAASKMKTHLTNQYDLKDKNKFFLENGSGLSNKSLITPALLTQFIHQAQRKHNIYPYLSIGGQTGWMSKRFREADLAFKVWSKTGSMDYVNNITGIFYSDSGKQYAFTFLLNDFKKRKKLTAPNSIKVNRIRDAAKKWKLTTTPFIDEVIASWIKGL